MLPLRDLMLQHMRAASRRAPGHRKVGEAMAFLQRLLALKPAIVAARRGWRRCWPISRPSHRLPVARILNEDWQPMPFAQVHDELQAAQLSFVCSSELHFRFKDIHHTKAQQEELARIEGLPLRESVSDALTARRFRREYWVRGARPLSRAETAQRLRTQRVVQAMPAHKVPADCTAAAARPCWQPTRSRRIRGTCRRRRAAGTGRVLDHALARGFDPNEMLDIVAALVGMRAIYPAAPASQVQAARPATLRLNAYLTGPHARRADILHVASPVSGGGVPAPAALQMMLAARSATPQQPTAGPVTSGRHAGLRPADDEGQQRVTDRATAITMLQPLVSQMQEQSLPYLRALGVVD